MAKAREPKVFKSMDDLPLMLTPYDLMDFLGKGQRQTYELIHGIHGYGRLENYGYGIRYRRYYEPCRRVRC